MGRLVALLDVAECECECCGSGNDGRDGGCPCDDECAGGDGCNDCDWAVCVFSDAGQSAYADALEADANEDEDDED